MINISIVDPRVLLSHYGITFSLVEKEVPNGVAILFFIKKFEFSKNLREKNYKYLNKKL